SRRPLLCGMEQARRSALAHHVHRTAPMGPRVLINGIWYNRPQEFGTSRLLMVSAQTPARSSPADSSPAYERAAPLWHGKSLWCRHCFASPIAAADAETQGCRFENPHIDCV